LILTSFVYAEVKIYAVKAKDINGTIYLTKPVIIYKNFYVQAQKGILTSKKQAILEKNVVIFYKDSIILANRVKVISKSDIKILHSFIIDKNMGIWFKNRIATIKGNIVYFKNTIFSSCCSTNPDWFLYSKSGSYNKKTKYMKLYNITLYIGKVPIFYFPFYFNSLNKQRRSGFLRPYIGYSSKEGFLFSLPYYLVLGQRADFEMTPTVRTRRGKGIYNTFRFVDSPYSFGKITFGEFIDRESYYTNNKLAHRKHYGYEIYYKRDRVFKKNDKLYMDLKYANDVEYFYLNAYNYTFNTSYLVDKIITSKVNYINPFGNNYIFGMYAKYFIDTSKLSNKDTIQILPQLNFHKFETKNIVLNSFDLNFYNYYSIPKRYYIATANVPLALNYSLFHDYLKIKLSENFDYVGGNYYNSSQSAQYFYQLYNSIKFYTSLTKKSSFLHIINPYVTLNIKQSSSISKQTDLLNYTRITNSLSMGLFQIFEKGDFYLDHDLREIVDTNFKNPRPMENIVNIKYKNISFSDNNKYDFNLKKVTYNTSSISFPYGKYFFKLSTVYQYSSTDNTLKTYTLRIERNLNQYKKIYFEYNYDMIKKYVKYFLFGIKLNKKCWQYDISLQKSRIPVLKDSGISYMNNYLFKLDVNFYPIGGVNQSIQLN
jgi:LPS-assembly protein